MPVKGRGVSIEKQKNWKSNGFDKNPQNINRKGRPRVKPLRDLINKLEANEAVIEIPIDKCEIDKKKGVVYVKIPNKEALAANLQTMAHSDVRWFAEWAKIMGEYAPTQTETNIDIEPTHFKVINGSKAGPNDNGNTD